MKTRLKLWKRCTLLLPFLLIFQSFVFSQQVAKTIPEPLSPEGIIGFLEFKPKDYGSQKHPLIIFLHGIGERGNGTSQINFVTANAIPKFCANGATMKFTVAGQTSTFVVLSPQLSQGLGSWPTWYIKDMIAYAKANLQIDTNRIYITGLSLGGGGIWQYAFESYQNSAIVAAAAPVCGTDYGNDPNACASAGAANLPIWCFHSKDDGTVSVNNSQHVQAFIWWCTPSYTPRPKFTYYISGGHSGAWDNAFDTAHRTVAVDSTLSGGTKPNVNFTANPNLYEWLLSNRRTPSGFTPPTADAGSDQTIVLPLGLATLVGSGSGTNGAFVSSYAWTKTSGPAAGSITLPGSAITTVTGLVQGTYVFTLTVTDNHGLSTSSNVTITVNSSIINQPPVANAGSNINITLPANSTTLDGSASNDPDGSITNYAWTKVSGPGQYNIVNSSAATTALDNLVQGTYTFRLQVTDNALATSSATVTVTVNAAPPPPNVLPIANAGAPINITLPTSNTTLDGSGSSDPDGSITTYAWTKTAGPAQYNIANSGAATTALNNLVQGTYTFRLQVTDNSGGTSSATVNVVVNPNPNASPVAKAGNDISITLPINNTTLDGSGSYDPDGSINTYAWTKISGPGQYNIANSGSATTALNNLVVGTYAFRLQVTDNGGISSADTVIVTVNAAANIPPTANAGSDLVITLPNTTTLDGSNSNDPDGTIVTYAWTKISGPAQYTIANAGAATTALSNLVAGVYLFRLVITDNSGASDVDAVMITVNPAANIAPTAKAGNDINITLPTNNTTLDGSASSDADGNISSYVWSKISGPAQYNIANSGSATTALTNLAQGTYGFRLVVTDNAGAPAADTVYVTVNAAPPPPNQLPVASAGGDINITLPTSNTTLDGSASSDPDGSITNYAWTKIAGPAQYNIVNSGAATTALNNLVQGTYSFRLVVTDNSGATDADTVNVVVNNMPPPPPNQLPVANAGGDINITLPTSNTSLNGSLSSDPDGSISSYAWSKIAGPAQYNIVNSGSATTALNNLAQGTYSFRLVVTDNAGATSADTVIVTVNAAPPPPNQLPVANAGADISIMLPVSNTTLDGSLSSDPDGSITNYAWTKIAGPAQYNIANSGSATTALNNLVAGTYSFRLLVTDNNGGTDADTVMVTVNGAPPPPNQVPVAHAGSDINITLPVSNTALDGSSSNDPDGSIINYEWTKISGPAQYNIVSSGSATTALNSLVQGVYAFRLVVIDNGGATAEDTVVVTVNAAPPPPNQLPVANAGSDINMTLPANTATLDGTNSYDPDGLLTNHAWTKIAGPAQYNMANGGEATATLSNLVQGTYSFRLVVTDSQGATDADTVLVTVYAAPPPPNQLPVANAGSDINITLPTSNTTLDGSASADPDGSITNYAWTKIAGPAQYNIVNSGAATTGLNNLVQGTYSFRLLVTDNSGATAADTVTVTVNAALPNVLPVANAGADINITLPINNTILDGSASSDPDGSITNYAWSRISGPAQYGITNAGAATTGLDNLVQGTYSFRLLVTDNSGATAADTVTVTVNPAPANQLPIANAGADINITLPANSTTLDGLSSYDPDGTISTYVWSMVAGPAQYNIANTATASTALTNLVQGTYTFKLVITDNSGATAEDEVTVTVHPAPPPPNQAPVANAGSDISITLPVSTTTLDGSASADPDGTITNYTWVKISGPAQYNIANSGAATTTLSNLVQGVYAFQLLVTDNDGAGAVDTVIVTVNPAPNQVPVANAGDDISITLPVSSASLDGTASADPDGSIVSYEWTKISGPSQFTLNNSTSAVADLTDLTEGVYEFRLVVTDNSGASNVDVVMVTVRPNQAPVANAGDDTFITLPVNSTTLGGSASVDNDGYIVSYEWTKISGPAQYTLNDANSATAQLTNLVAGVYEFRLVVTDNGGESSVDVVMVTVNRAPNVLPVANAGADSSIYLPVSYITLNGTNSYDPDGTINSYSWTKISGQGSTTIVNSNTAQPTVLGLQEGTYVFELAVTDNDGAVVKDYVTVVVNAALNVAPVANAGKDTSVSLPATAAVLDGSLSKDADGNIKTYEWKQKSGPVTAVITDKTAIKTSLTGLQEGEYVFELTVTDDAGASSKALVKVIVVNAFRYSQFFKIYPNPAVSTLHLQYIDDKTGKIKVVIFDVAGKVVMQQEVTKNQSLVTHDINISELKSGMYYLQVQQANGIPLLRPFVKQ